VSFSHETDQIQNATTAFIPSYNFPMHTFDYSIHLLSNHTHFITEAVFIKLLKKISYLSKISKCTFLIYFQLYFNETMFFISMQSFIEVVHANIEKSGSKTFTQARNPLKQLYKYGPRATDKACISSAYKVPFLRQNPTL